MPLLLYQIDTKFRNELRPRYGLLRTNQFIMKDLYSFDKDQESAFQTYANVCESYSSLFARLGLDFIKVKASNGLIGGKFSHEFHLISKYGEDDIYLCASCKVAFNKETLDESELKNQECPECKKQMEHKNSIEIGHTFYLGTRYSKKMNACYVDANLQKIPLEMCCFGIGITRILAAFITQSESIEIEWPFRIAPYHILIISPKKGSKQNVDEAGSRMAGNIANALKLKGFDVLIDDRLDLTIGRRQIDSLAYGFPYRIIIGKESIDEIPKFEFNSKSEKTSLTHAELLNKFEQIARNQL